MPTFAPQLPAEIRQLGTYLHPDDPTPMTFGEESVIVTYDPDGATTKMINYILGMRGITSQLKVQYRSNTMTGTDITNSYSDWLNAKVTTCTACTEDYQIGIDTGDWINTKACYKAYKAYSNIYARTCASSTASTAYEIVDAYANGAGCTGDIPRWIVEVWALKMQSFYDEKTVDRGPAHLEGRLRDIIASRSSPAIHIKRRYEVKPLPETADLRELRARQTLRRLIGDPMYQRLLQTGSVTIQGPSGKWYNLKPGHGYADVYQNGKKIDSLCIVLSGDFPPTDSLIMRVMMVWNDEESLWKIANKIGAHQSDRTLKMPDQRPLTQILGELRQKYPKVPIFNPASKGMSAFQRTAEATRKKIDNNEMKQVALEIMARAPMPMPLTA